MAFTEYEVKYRNIKVKISDGTIITGQVNILTFTRLSEYLKQSNDKFIVVTETGESIPGAVTRLFPGCCAF
ncbi:MAG: putative cytosolic protein [Deltaproteobacteria bacterium]|nr:putative cytosolic protein [Deltaproteobacteria bacterium]